MRINKVKVKINNNSYVLLYKLQSIALGQHVYLSIISHLHFLLVKSIGRISFFSYLCAPITER